MQKQLRLFVALIVIVLLVLSWFIWQSWGIITKVEIVGNGYLPKSEILSVLPRGRIHISDSNSLLWITQIKKNPFVREVSLESRWIHTLVIHLQVQTLIGKVIDLQTSRIIGYLVTNGMVLSPPSMAISPLVPEIVFHPSVPRKQIADISRQLSIFQFSYPSYFQKFRRINLSNFKNVSIIIESSTLGMSREYVLFHTPSVRDFIEIFLLDRKYDHGSKILLDGSAVIVKD